MGNHIARAGNGSHKKVESATAGTGNATHATNATAAAPKSEPDHPGSHMQFVPIESLAKVSFFDLTQIVSPFSSAPVN